MRGKPKSGTTWFHAYATAYTILSGRRVTVALAFVKNSDGKLEVVRELIRLVEGQGIEFRCLYLDRAFFTADIIHYLQVRDIQFLMPAIVRGKERKGTRALMKGRTGYTTLYTMRSAKTRIAVTFPVHVVVTYSKGRQGKNKAITYLYASSSLIRRSSGCRRSTDSGSASSRAIGCWTAAGYAPRRGIRSFGSCMWPPASCS